TTVMRAPRTYTREDVVEINCHGGRQPLTRVLRLLLAAGARLASPGEFTKRAFLNGRIDLAQAEAVADIVRAKTDMSLAVAMRGLDGRLSAAVAGLRDRLVAVLAHLEATVDFADEHIEPLTKTEAAQGAAALAEELETLLATGAMGRIYREGLAVSLCGRPNVGKSSLLNALLGQNRAIVTPLPGTTRDLIEESIEVGGVCMRLQDTAGVRRPRDMAEEEGVARSRASLAAADIRLIILDSGEPLRSDDVQLLDAHAGEGAVVVLNKIDAALGIDEHAVRELAKGSSVCRVSALDGAGLAELRDALVRSAFSGLSGEPEDVLVANARHRQALSLGLDRLREAIRGLQADGAEEVVAVSLRECLDSLGEISGETTGEDVLDRIFSDFCIGK
ncbi:MAG: tRNA uridine-5-carboxymethylaminomethyl(34) synthesis GTPase MnmE, partial [Terriglobia bacterium]